MTLRMTTFRLDETKSRGFGVILLAIGLVSMLGILSFTLSLFTAMHQKRIVAKINRVEGYYMGEVSAWHYYFTEKNAPSSLCQSSACAVNFENDYALRLPSSLIGDSTYPGNYEEGASLNVDTTLQYDTGRTIFRRYSVGNLNYLIANKENTPYCGRAKFSGKKSYGVCLVLFPETTPKSSTLPCPDGLRPIPSTLDCLGLFTPPASTTLKPVQLISTQAELQTVISDGNYKLAKDITLDSSFTPLSGTTSNIILDGDGHTISDFIVSTSPDGKLGLFKELNNSLIKNLKFKNIKLGSIGTTLVGALAASTNGGCIDRVSVEGGEITSYGTGGGLVGSSTGIIANSMANLTAVSIAEGSGTGGETGIIGILVGELLVTSSSTRLNLDSFSVSSSLIVNSYSLGDVKFSGEPKATQNLGGLVGNLQASVVRSCSGANITGAKQTGGLVGNASPNSGIFFTGLPQVIRSFASGSVIGTPTGGLVGGVASGGIFESYAMGSLNINRGSNLGGGNAGGLVGFLSLGEISNCFAQGSVSGNESAGLVGNNSGKIKSSYALGKILWGVDTGGLVARSAINLGHGPSGVDCFWDTQTSGRTTSSEGVGKTTKEMKTLATYQGGGSQANGSPGTTPGGRMPAMGGGQESSQGWDFDKVWILPPDDYPKLRWQVNK